MSTYYVRDDGNDSNDGRGDSHCCAKKTLDAAKSVCLNRDVVVKSDAPDEDGLCQAYLKNEDGSFTEITTPLA